MSTAEKLPESYAARDAEVRAILAGLRSVLERSAEQDAEIVATLASVADCLEECRCILEDNANDIAGLQSENGELRSVVEESGICCRQLREMAEMALALAASKGSRSAGRILATFKASYATAQEATR